MWRTVLKAGYKSVLLDNDASEEVKDGSDEWELIGRDACHGWRLTGRLEEPHGWVPKHVLSTGNIWAVFVKTGHCCFFCFQVLVFHSTSNFTNFPRKSLGSPSQHVQKVVSKVRVTVHHSGHFLLGNLASQCSWLIKESQKPCRTETWPFWSFQNRIVQLNHISLMFNFLWETESNSLDCVVSNLKVSNFRWFAIVFSWDFLLYGFNSTIIKRFSI